MSNICRLCLSFCTQNMRPLTDCDGIVYDSISFFVHGMISGIKTMQGPSPGFVLSPFQVSSQSVQQFMCEEIPLNPAFPSRVCSICINKLTDFNMFYLQVKKNEETLQKKLNYGGNALDNFYEQIKEQMKYESNEQVQENKDNTENDISLSQMKTEDFNFECGVDFDSDDELPLLQTRNINTDDTHSLKVNVNTDTSDKYLEKNGIYTHYNYNFKCLTCFKTFISQDKLLTHYNEIHKAKEEMKGNNYTPIHKDEKLMYKCNNCDKTYGNVRSVNKHAKTHCDENFHCKICGRTYKTVSEIIRHGRAHDGTKMSCSFGCGFATVYSGALKSHERRHREDFKYKCETCGKSFQVKTWYEQHQNVHTGDKPYSCDICGMAFHMDRYLKAHCSAVHPEASSRKRYVCVQCSKPCGNMKALTKHLKEHGVTSSLLCDLCGKTLSSTEQLAIHRRLHMGVKPYSCSICAKSFAKRSNLKLHQITHSGERAHACAACGKRYSQRSTLLRHVHRHHTADKKCPKCDATFTTQADLTAHQKLCSS